ncbi:MAG: ABC transporter permease [Pseudomonadales bacterium]|nr:ABC transporter permease [Pseudomonadales bacterium]
MFVSFWTHRSLVNQLLRREIQSRYRGSVFGILWSLMTPLLMLVIYTLVFKYIFQARWLVPGIDGRELNFAIMLFMGLIVHGMLGDMLARSPGLILSHVNFVKKVVFPLEILPWVALLSNLFNFTISFILLLGLLLFETQQIPVTALLVPFILLPYLLLLLGLSWLLAAIGVYIRDIQHISGTLTTLLLFLSPVFYSIDTLPDKYQFLMLLNPIALIVEACRSVVVLGQLPALQPLLIYSAVSLLIAVTGYRVFQRSRRGFADVL